MSAVLSTSVVTVVVVMVVVMVVVPQWHLAAHRQRRWPGGVFGCGKSLLTHE